MFLAEKREFELTHALTSSILETTKRRETNELEKKKLAEIELKSIVLK